MPEALGDAGAYFDPVQPDSIATAVRELVTNHVWRTQVAHQAYQRAQAYSWERCAHDTFSYLAEVAARALPEKTIQSPELAELNSLSGRAK